MKMRLVATCVRLAVSLAVDYLLCWRTAFLFVHALRAGRPINSGLAMLPLLDLVALWCWSLRFEDATWNRVPATFTFPIVVALGIVILLLLPY